MHSKACLHMQQAICINATCSPCSTAAVLFAMHALPPQDFYLDTLKQAVLAANPALTGKVQQMLEDVAASASASSTPQQAS